jgi:hypothetical protein
MYMFEAAYTHPSLCVFILSSVIYLSSFIEHCEQHLSLNPNSSYVTWIATIHPENAAVSIDPRFLISGNPWLTVYNEAIEDLQKNQQRRVVPSKEVSPTPSAPPLDQDDHVAQKKKKCVGGSGSLLDYVIGTALILVSVAASFAIELIAAYCYLSYWLCHKIVATCSPLRCWTCLPLSIAYILGKVFQVLDTVLLFVSIIIVECIAIVNYVVCTILACSAERGKSMHQMTRKLSHLIRWAARKKFEKWSPPRTTGRAK